MNNAKKAICPACRGLIAGHSESELRAHFIRTIGAFEHSNGISHDDRAVINIVPQREHDSECRRVRRLANAGLSEGDLAMAMGVDRLTVRRMLEETEAEAESHPPAMAVSPKRFEPHASAWVDDHCLCGAEYRSHPDDARDVYAFIHLGTEIACPYFREYCRWLAVADIANTSFRSFEAGWRRMLHYSRFAGDATRAECEPCAAAHWLQENDRLAESETYPVRAIERTNSSAIGKNEAP